MERWILRANATAEGGSNAGSDLELIARTDAGAAIDNVLTVTRAAGGTMTIARPVSISSTLAVTSLATLTAGYKTTSGNCYTGDDANANMTLGLTINQGAADDEALAFKSSDVAHGVTDIGETDTYAQFKKWIPDNGGLQINGYTEVAAAINLKGIAGTAATGKTSASGLTTAHVQISAELKSGTGTAQLGATENILRLYDGAQNCYLFGCDAFFIANSRSVPGSNATDGGLVYVEGGALKYRGSGGTVTTIAAA